MAVTGDRPPGRATVEEWLFDDFCSGLTDALGAMLTQAPAANWKRQEAAPEAIEFLWRQPLTCLAGELLLATTHADIAAIGQQVMSNLGAADATEEELAETAREAFGQAFASVARSLSARLGEEVSSAGGGPWDGGPPPVLPAATWVGAHLTAGGARISLALGISAGLIEAILDRTRSSSVPAHAPAAEPAPASAATPPASASQDGEFPGLGRLLDVELSVSVSFGKAHLALKEVLKLTNGSIIELGRSVVEPVDILVNNVVIAHGEVVVVEGNFGVRIQRVVSRRERLEALP